MDKEFLVKPRDAGDALCVFCECDYDFSQCKYCMMRKVIEASYSELPNGSEEL